ncbi:hypothetical protein, partial [Pedobacter fastidiosus]|uniref:hypothetical protein n=1 Tax=Pedobacter fastidiosus TaxID=2765361 RepID=UPI001C9A3CC1
VQKSRSKIGQKCQKSAPRRETGGWCKIGPGGGRKWASLGWIGLEPWVLGVLLGLAGFWRGFGFVGGALDGFRFMDWLAGLILGLVWL